MLKTFPNLRYIDNEGNEYYIKELLKNTENLTERERKFVNNRASIDFVVFDKMDKKPRLLIEVDGFEYHENKPEQIERDKLKNEVVQKNNLKLLRFETGRNSGDLAGECQHSEKPAVQG